MSARELVACSLSLVACACYGFTIVFTKVKLKEAPSSARSRRRAARGRGARSRPSRPGAAAAAPVPAMAWLSVLALGVFCTGFAFILYYRLIADLGPVKAITVTLLIPVFGMLWGVLLPRRARDAGADRRLRDHPRRLRADPRARALAVSRLRRGKPLERR